MTYSWTPTGSLISTTDSVVQANPLTTTTYTVTGTDHYGCVNTDQVTVTVNPLPLVTAQGDIQLCNQSIPTQLTATTVDVGTGVWSGSPYISSTGEFTPSGTPSGTGTFTVYYTFTITATGCTNVDSVEVTVEDPANLTLQNDTTVCHLTPMITLGSSISGGTWTGTQVSFGGDFIPSQVGTFTLNYEVGSGSCYQSESMQVTVTALPSITLTSDTEICIGESQSLVVSGDGTTYDWSPSSTLSSNTGTTVTATPITTTTYQVISTDGNGCVDSSDVTVIVNELPVVDAGLDSSVCISTNVNLQPNVVVDSIGGTYTWSGQHITSAGIFNSSNTGIFDLIVDYTDPNSCQDSDTIEICVLDSPVADFSVDNNTGCLNASNSSVTVQTTNLSNTLGGCRDATYAWSVSFVNSACGNTGNATFASGSSASDIDPAFEFFESGIYEISLTVTNQCSSSTHVETITIGSPPEVSINAINNDCGTTTITPVAVVSDCNYPVTSYAWDFSGADGSTTSGVLNPSSVTYSNSGNSFTVSLGVTNSCGTTSEQETFTLHNLPEITPSSNEPICFDETLELEVTIDTSDAPIASYAWSGPNGFTSSYQNDSIPNAILAANGTYSVTVTDDNGCTQTGITIA